MASILSVDTFDLSSDEIVIEILGDDYGWIYLDAGPLQAGFHLQDTTIQYRFRDYNTTNSTTGVIHSGFSAIVKLVLNGNDLEWYVYNGSSYDLEHTETLASGDNVLFKSCRIYASSGGFTTDSFEVGSINYDPLPPPPDTFLKQENGRLLFQEDGRALIL